MISSERHGEHVGHDRPFHRAATAVENDHNHCRRAVPHVRHHPTLPPKVSRVTAASGSWPYRGDKAPSMSTWPPDTWCRNRYSPSTRGA